MNNKSTRIPQIYTYSGLGDYGTIVVEKLLNKPKVLTDVNLRLLKYVIGKWSARNTVEGKKDNTLFGEKVPTLYFTLSLSETYKGRVVLCRASSEVSPLTVIEKLAIRLAFKFSSPKEEQKPNFTTKKALDVLTEHAVLAIRNRDGDGFEEAFNKLKHAHGLLLSLGEFSDKGRAINYAVIESSFFGALHSEWAQTYRKIFDEATKDIDEDDEFFKVCCYTAYALGQDVMQNPSHTGLDSILRMQGYLWFRLNKWWESNCEQQGQVHDNENPSELKPPQGKIFKEAMVSYIQAWGSLQGYVLSLPIKKGKSNWQNSGRVFLALERHMKETVSHLVRSVLTGNKEAASFWTEYMLLWNTSSQPISHGNDFWMFSKREKIKILPDLLDKDWSIVEADLRKIIDFPYDRISQETVFSLIIQNYWQDSLHILVEFLINWSVDCSHPEKSLSAETAKRLIHATRTDDSSVHGKITFLEGFDDYISSFIRRGTYHRWNKGTYGARMSGIAELIDGHTEKERMAGRVYSSHGSSIEKISVTDLVLGAISVAKKSTSTEKIEKSVEKYLADHQIAASLEYEIRESLKQLETFPINHYRKVFNFIFDKKEEIQADYSQENQEGSASEKFSSEALDTSSIEGCLDALKASFLSLQDAIKNVRAQQISALPVVEDKLKKMAEEASQEAFAKDTAEFPVSLFGEVILTNKERLKEFKLNHNEFPKGVLTEPSMDNVHYPEDWHHNAVSSRLYPYLTFDIYEEAKSLESFEKVSVRSEQKYADAIVRLSQQIIAQGLTPIIIVEDFRTPQWLLDWDDARWHGKEKKLPKGIEIQHQDDSRRGGYLFSVNHVPVFEGRALMGGTLIMPQESLTRLKFKQMDFGYPVEVTFSQNEEDPWHGRLTYRWERGVELDQKLPIYQIKYPKKKKSD